MTEKTKAPKPRKLAVRKQTIKDLNPKASKARDVKGGILDTPNISKETHGADQGAC